jgi:hypothetical protein
VSFRSDRQDDVTRRGLAAARAALALAGRRRTRQHLTLVADQPDNQEES